MVKLLASGITDTGRVREQNEDVFLLLPDHNIFVVADGMGGHNCGEVASQLSISSIKSFYEDEELERRLRVEFQERRSGDGSPASFAEYRLMRSMESANRSIFNTAQRFEAYREMGTTVVGIHVVKSRAYVGFVGDSRAYRLRDGKLEQLSEDHSLANEYVRMKVISKDDVRSFPYRNVIVRALGLGPHVEVDTFYRTCKSSDIFLLCSDGLTDLVEDQEIQKILNAYPNDLDAANQALVDAANEYGGVDNITCLLVKVV